MCSIVGVRRQGGTPVVDDVLAMMDVTAHRGPDGASVADLDHHETATGPEALKGALPELPWAMGHLRLAITGDVGVQPMRDCDHRFVVAFNGEIWNHAELRARLEDDHTMEQDSDADVLPHLIEEHLEGDGLEDLADAVLAALDELDGEYAIAVMNEAGTVLVRDPLGIKPLYHAPDGDGHAFASEQKALWACGLEPERVPPNSAVLLEGPRATVRTRAPPADPEASALPGRDKAFAAYEAAFERAIAKRIRGQERVAIVFSGGVDSAMVAAAAAQHDVEVTCYVAGEPGSSDVAAARETAEAMGLDLRVASLAPEDVAGWLPDVLAAVEDRNQLHVETALPLFAVCRRVREDGIRVLLTGQGADELFAGYPWYPRVLEADGPEGLRARMREDRDLLFRETLEREDKVAMHHSLELRVPFLDPEVVAIAERVPLTLLVDGPGDAMGKRLHRELAAHLGLPEPIAWRKKEAAQHGSGSRRVLQAAVERLGMGAVPADYDPAESIGELVGSSQRYGHRYADAAGAWDLDAALQWALDGLASEEDLVAPADRERVERARATPATPAG